MGDLIIVPPWFDIAHNEIGTREYTKWKPGPGGLLSNPRVEAYQKAAGGRMNDEIPWCASFLRWVLIQAGLPGGTGTGARALAYWGRRLIEPRIGCISVFWRDSPDSGNGHVHFHKRIGTASGRFYGIGGNQGNMVSLAPYARERLICHRWPTRKMLEAIGRLDLDIAT